MDLVVPEGTFEAHNHSCSYVVMAGNNDVIIVDLPNWPHTVLFQHVTNNANQCFGRGCSNTPADHDVVDFRKAMAAIIPNVAKGPCVFLYLRPQL